MKEVTPGTSLSTYTGGAGDAGVTVAHVLSGQWGFTLSAFDASSATPRESARGQKRARSKSRSPRNEAAEDEPQAPPLSDFEYVFVKSTAPPTGALGGAESDPSSEAGTALPTAAMAATDTAENAGEHSDSGVVVAPDDDGDATAASAVTATEATEAAGQVGMAATEGEGSEGEAAVMPDGGGGGTAAVAIAGGLVVSSTTVVSLAASPAHPDASKTDVLSLVCAADSGPGAAEAATMTPLDAFPPSGLYRGAFMLWQPPPAPPQRIEERDLSLTFTRMPAAPSPWSQQPRLGGGEGTTGEGEGESDEGGGGGPDRFIVTGSGENMYGPFTISGTAWRPGAGRAAPADGHASTSSSSPSTAPVTEPELHALSEALMHLDEDLMSGAIHIIEADKRAAMASQPAAESEALTGGDGGDEVEVDLEQLPQETLRKLQAYAARHQPRLPNAPPGAPSDAPPPPRTAAADDAAAVPEAETELTRSSSPSSLSPPSVSEDKCGGGGGGGRGGQWLEVELFRSYTTPSVPSSTRPDASGGTHAHKDKEPSLRVSGVSPKRARSERSERSDSPPRVLEPRATRARTGYLALSTIGGVNFEGGATSADVAAAASFAAREPLLAQLPDSEHMLTVRIKPPAGSDQHLLGSSSNGASPSSRRRRRDGAAVDAPTSSFAPAADSSGAGGDGAEQQHWDTRESSITLGGGQRGKSLSGMLSYLANRDERARRDARRDARSAGDSHDDNDGDGGSMSDTGSSSDIASAPPSRYRRPQLSDSDSDTDTDGEGDRLLRDDPAGSDFGVGEDSVAMIEPEEVSILAI